MQSPDFYPAVIPTDPLEEFQFNDGFDRHRSGGPQGIGVAVARLNVAHSDLSTKRLGRNRHAATAPAGAVRPPTAVVSSTPILA